MSITRILTNPDSIAVQANLASLQTQLSNVVSHLSTGLRIVTGADDPSGVALSSKFRSQQSGIEVAIGNVQDGLSLFATADSALNDTQDMLRRMRDLAVKASNGGVLTTTDRQNIDTEFQALKTEINRRSSSVTFNTKNLLDGTYSSQLLQIGPDNNANLQISLTLQTAAGSAITASALGISATIGLSDAGGAAGSAARNTLDIVQSALNQISTIQAGIGVTEMKLGHVINDLQSQDTNIAAAKSRITDADMASEISSFTKLQILTQVSTAMLAQANAQPQSVLKLLGIA